MSGITNLETLLQQMAPQVRPEEYVYCTFAGAAYGDYAELNPIASFVEEEGLTLVLTKASADQHQLAYASILKAITLTVHSSLEAVGLTAAVATKLTEHNISANVIAGYYHDHVFVQSDRADDALAALREFAG